MDEAAFPMVVSQAAFEQLRAGGYTGPLVVTAKADTGRVAAAWRSDPATVPPDLVGMGDRVGLSSASWIEWR